MRTLKKVLALSLVFAMAFTLMAGAAFKDQDSISSDLNDDITLLTALGVFKGDENGNFNPAANVKRSEAAKMIFVLKNGGDDNASAFEGVSKYADVPTGHWAEGYINYCTNLGIMNGWKEGNVQKFDPNGNVTGVELTKMLLCLIGYKSDIQGYTGNGWQTNVLQDAADAGITVNYNPSIYEASPRQWTARLLVNALNAPYVTYSKGELTFGTVLDPNMSYGEKYLGLATVTGTLKETNHNKLGTEIKNIDSSLNDSDYSYVVTGTKDGAPVGRSFKVNADPSLLGQPVKVYYKSSSSVSEEDNKVYAVLPYSKNVNVVNTTVDEVKYDDRDTEAGSKKITVSGLGTKTYTDTKTMNLYMNNVLYKKDAKIQDLKEFLGINSTLPVTLVADKDGYINTVLIKELSAYAQVDKNDSAKNTFTLKKLSNYAGTKLVDADMKDLTFNNTSDNKENYAKYLNFVDTVEADDIVKITANTTSGKLVYDITKAESVTGTPSSYSLNNDGDAISKLTINGTTYKKADTAMVLKDYTWGRTTSVSTDDNFYTDGKYVIYSKGGTSSVSVTNLAYVIGTATRDSFGEVSYKAKVLLSNGTIGEYEVAATYKLDGGDLKKTAATIEGKSVKNGVDVSLLDPGTVMTYSLSSDKITLKQLKGDSNITFATGTQKFVDSNNTVTLSGGGSYKTTADTYFFVKTAEPGKEVKYSVVKASELSNDVQSLNSGSYATKKVDGIPSILFGVLDLNSQITSKAADYVFMNNSASLVMDGEQYKATVVVLDQDGNEVTLEKVFDDRESGNTEVAAWNALKGKVVTYKLDTNGKVDGSIEKVTAATSTGTLDQSKWNKVSVLGWNGTSAYVHANVADKTTDTDGVYVNVSKDVKIHSIDASESKAAWNGLTTDVEKSVKADSKYVQSAYAYVELVDGELTITHIFTEQDGASIAKVW